MRIEQRAFRRDIRARYDVLVLYDSRRSSTKPGAPPCGPFGRKRQGTRGSAPRDRGLPDWPWWYREVVGGPLSRKAGRKPPGSSYKHDVELFIRPAPAAPDYGDIGPMHVLLFLFFLSFFFFFFVFIRETYKGREMRGISPEPVKRDRLPFRLPPSGLCCLRHVEACST